MHGKHERILQHTIMIRQEVRDTVNDCIEMDTHSYPLVYIYRSKCAAHGLNVQNTAAYFPAGSSILSLHTVFCQTVTDKESTQF